MIVVLDTTALHGDVYAKGAWLTTLFQAAEDRDDLNVWIPSAVVEELVRQFPDRLAATRKALRSNRYDSRAFGWELPDLPENIEAETFAYRPALVGRLKGKGRKIAPHPSSIELAVEWVAQRRKPANESGRGAVDAAVWLTVLEAAETTTDVVLVTQNSKDFSDPAEPSRVHEMLAGDLEKRDISSDRVSIAPNVLEVNRAHVEPSLAANQEAELLLGDPSQRAILESEIADAAQYTPIEVEQASEWLATEIDDAVLGEFLPESLHLLRADPLEEGVFYMTLEIHGVGRLELGLRKGDAYSLREGSPIHVVVPDWNESMARAEAEIPFQVLADVLSEHGKLSISIEDVYGGD